MLGIENDIRSHFFGSAASTQPVTKQLITEFPKFHTIAMDTRDADGILRLFPMHRHDIQLIVHTAAQPSHDWAARDPQTDFAVNANGT